jgi:hypothetical protein
MALLTVQNVVAAGITPSYAASTTSDTFADDGAERTFLHVKNTNAAIRTLTIAPAVASASVPGVGSVTIPSMSVTIPANTGDRMVGPFPPAYINTSGLVTATLDAAAGVTVAAIKLGKVG